MLDPYPRYPEGPIPLNSAFRCLEQLPPDGEVTLTLELRSIYTLLVLLEPPSSPHRFGLRFQGGERTGFERRWNRGECQAFQKLSKAVNAAFALHQGALRGKAQGAV